MEEEFEVSIRYGGINGKFDLWNLGQNGPVARGSPSNESFEALAPSHLVRLQLLTKILSDSLKYCTPHVVERDLFCDKKAWGSVWEIEIGSLGSHYVVEVL